MTTINITGWKVERGGKADYDNNDDKDDKEEDDDNNNDDDNDDKDKVILVHEEDEVCDRLGSPSPPYISPIPIVPYYTSAIVDCCMSLTTPHHIQSA